MSTHEYLRRWATHIRDEGQPSVWTLGWPNPFDLDQGIDQPNSAASAGFYGCRMVDLHRPQKFAAVGGGVSRQDAPMRDAIRLMLDHGISGLPVTDSSGKMVGILSEGDLLRRAEMETERQHSRWLEFLLGPGRLADEYTHTHGRRVGEIMTEDVVSVADDTPVTEIVRLMERHQIKRLPVLRGSALVGIVTRADLMRALAKLVDQLPTSASDDDEIRKRLLAELERTAWAPLGSVTIAVNDGIVELDGVITNEKEREAVHVAAENVPGVKGVRDRLVWVEPLSGTVIGAP